MKICVLPIDSRPCTYDFVRYLADIAGLDVVMPPIAHMGGLLVPSDFSVISRWLFDNAVDCDALVISVEQLIYGGLIASRKNGIDLREAQERLKALVGLKQANPELKILAFTVLMRTTVSTLSIESVAWWEAVGEYSKYVHLGDEQKVQELAAKIPADVLSEFLAVRERNHEVNKRCVELVHEGVIDFLPILQEDCGEYGMHKAEQVRLTELIEKYDIEHKVSLHNGTDEAATELMARAATSSPAPIAVKWLGYNADFVALFEDRPFKQNLMSHLRTVNMYEDAAADIVLFIYVPKTTQGDFCTLGDEIPITGYCQDDVDGFAVEIADAIAQGKKCYLLDISFANGGDAELLKCLAQRIDIGQLHGYSAWNTACNALGTILSQIVMSGGKNDNNNRNFTYGRILDDVIYQGIVRKCLNRRLIAQGLDPWMITDLGAADEILQAEFAAAQPIIDEIMPDCPPFAAKWRWSRTFEIEISINDAGGA